MTIIRVPLTQEIESRTNSLSKDSKNANGFFEKRDNNIRDFVKRPGYTNLTLTGTTLEAAQAQGMFKYNGNLYVVINNTLTKVTPSLVASTIGNISGTLHDCYFVNTSNNVWGFFHNGTNGYTLNQAGTLQRIDPTGVYAVTIATGGSGYTGTPTVTFSAPSGIGFTAVGTVETTGGVVTSITITSPGSGYTTPPTVTINPDTGGTGATANCVLSGFPSTSLAAGVAFIDGYVVVGTTNGYLYTSDLENASSWNPLNYVAVEAEPDNLVGICKHLNYVLAFGEWSTECFYDAAISPGCPLARQDSARLEIGCADGNSIVQFEQAVMFVGKARSHGKSVYIMDGLAPVKVSTRYIEKYLNADQATDMEAFAFKISGHTFYVLTLHDSDLTFVYDVDEKQWYNWTSYYNAGEHYWWPTYYCEFNNSYYALLHDLGIIASLSTDYTSDNGSPIYYRAVTSILDSGTTKRKFWQRAEVVGDKVSATLKIRHSNDDYVTWSNYRSVDLSASRPQLYQLGADRRRAYEFLVTDNVAIRLQAVEMDVEGGEMEADPNVQTRR